MNVARVIEEYCKFHDIVPEERIRWLEPSGRPIVDDIRAALADPSPPAADSTSSALDSVGLTPVPGAWGTTSSSSESTVTLVCQAPEVCVAPRPPASQRTTSKSSKKEPEVDANARQFYVRAGMVDEEPRKSHRRVRPSDFVSSDSKGLYDQ